MTAAEDEAAELMQVKAYMADAFLAKAEVIHDGQEQILDNQRQILRIAPTIRALVITVLLTFILFASAAVVQAQNAKDTKALIQTVCDLYLAEHPDPKDQCTK